MRFVVVSGSLSPQSTSAALARAAEARILGLGHECDFVDLREHDLPLCGSPGCADHPAVASLAARFRDADGALLAAPIYNYDVNAALKNLVELVGRSLSEKVVGFLLSAGGQAAYMAPLGLANSLMLDFRCIVLPRFVYALGKSHFNEGGVSDPAIKGRVDELAGQLVRVSGALARES